MPELELKLEEKFKKHIYFEEGMDESMLSFYLEAGKKYVRNATGGEAEYLVMMVAAIMYEYRVSELELSRALNAITPLIVQEAMSDGEAPDE